MARHLQISMAGLCVFLLSGLLIAQVSTGTISGTVKDSSGAVLPGAQIVILNEETGISRTVQSDAAGHYSASSLGLGRYRVTATLQGFQTEVRSGIVLTVAQEAIVDLALPVGAVSQTVEVAGEAPAIETTTATVSGLVNQEQIRDLPLNGRSYADLALLSPGVLYNRTTGSDPSTGFGPRLSVNGSRADSNLYLIDGALASDTADSTGGVDGSSLGVEAVREFRVLTHNFSAEYGRNSGAVISLVTRSGTNQLHGSLYEFVRNNIFDARSFNVQGELPAFRRNQFGAAAGGPIKKDRIFFFANYEGLRQRLASPLTSNVPDLNARNGIVPCKVIQSPIPIPSACSTGTPDTLVAFPGFNPAVKPYLDLYPVPNFKNFGDGTAQNVTNLSLPSTEDYAMGRIDVHLSDKDNVYFRYIFNPSNDIRSRPTPNFNTPDDSSRHFIVLAETHVFSPTALNDFHAGFSRAYNKSITQATVPIDPALSFVPGFDIGNIRYSATNATNSAAGTLSELGNSRNQPFGFTQNLFQETDTFTLVRGSHSLKFGADLERSDFNSVFGSNFRGDWIFGGLVPLLQGLPATLNGAIIGGTSTRERGFRRFLFGWFVQDDFRVSSRLTLNLGLRHEFFTSPTEVNGRSADLRNITDPASTVGPPFITAKLNFAPRVGVAWDPAGSGKTSIRVGAGVYFNQIDNRTWTRLSSADVAFFTMFTVRNPLTFPRVPANPALAAQSEFAVQYHLDTPTNVHYGLDIQRQITPTISARLGYVGSHGYNNTRIAFPDIRIPTIVNGQKSFTTNNATNPFVNPNFSTIEMLRADVEDNYNGLQAMIQKSAGAGLVFQASYSLSKALSVSDTAANRQVDNGGPYNTMDWTDPERDYGRSSYDQRHTFTMNAQYRLPVDKYLTNHLSKAALGGWTINGIYTYGSGLPLNVSTGFNNSNDGDTNNPDRPNLTPGFSNDPTHGVSAGCSFGGITIPAGLKLHTPDRWFDPCAFTLPTAGLYGNLGRNTLSGPNFNQFNFTLVKNTALTESKRLEFRAEFFNLFNHTSYGLPILTAFTSTRSYAGNAGVISSFTASGRQIQFGMKLVF